MHGKDELFADKKSLFKDVTAFFWMHRAVIEWTQVLRLGRPLHDMRGAGTNHASIAHIGIFHHIDLIPVASMFQ